MTDNTNSLFRNQIWSTRSICKELFGSTSPSNLKKTERWLTSQKLDYPLLDQKKLADEHGRAARSLVVKQVVKTTQKTQTYVFRDITCSKNRGSFC